MTLARCPSSSDAPELDRALVVLTGGMLWRADESRKARFELRAYAQQRTALVALHDFTPRLPRWLHVPTQALAHEGLMKALALHLAHQSPAAVWKVTEGPVATGHLVART